MKAYSSLGKLRELILPSKQLPHKITFELSDDGINYITKMYTVVIIDNEEREVIVETLSRFPSTFEVVFDNSKKLNEQVLWSIEIPDDTNK